MSHFRTLALRSATSLGLALVATAGLGAQSQNCPATGKGPLPYKYNGGATVTAITPCDLMTRLYKYADDSMMGRAVGTEYHHKAVSYIASELKRLGLQPGGDNGTYYQDFDISLKGMDPISSLTVGSQSYKFGPDFVTAGLPPVMTQFANAQVVYVGQLSDTLSRIDSAAVAGKVLLVVPNAAMKADEQRAMVQSEAYKAFLRARTGALATVNVMPDSLWPLYQSNFGTPGMALGGITTPPAGTASRYPTLIVTRKVGAAMMGSALESATRGQVGGSFSSNLTPKQSAAPSGRNVVAILPGSDPKLKGEYIAIGGHSDHVGFAGGGQCGRTVASDSQHVWNSFGLPAGAEGGRNISTSPITAQEWSEINGKTAELRKTIPERVDSICNGADDDGTGSVSVLEIAEQFAKGNVKPKRSIIFVWHAGEERGMWGSGYFVDHPTVPRDSIVAQLNIDMVGRGAPSDVTGQAKDGGTLHGGDRYVQLVGSRRLSTELGDLVETVNKEKGHAFNFDYNIDANGHPQNIYCRSDHWSYARWGIPVVFFTTGGHADYHQVTDEPQYIRYTHMAALDSLIFDIAVKAANLDHRVVVDGTKPNPLPAGMNACKQ